MVTVTLQVVPKDLQDVCVVNVEEKELREGRLRGDISDTYCRIIHNAMYEGAEIENESKLPEAMVQELRERMDYQVVPALNRKGISCTEFFTTRDTQEIKDSYPEYNGFYEVEVELQGCIEDSNSQEEG